MIMYQGKKQQIVRRKRTYNKQFKRDSQRLAFLVLLQIKCLWHNALGLGGSVAHPLIGRYV